MKRDNERLLAWADLVRKALYMQTEDQLYIRELEDRLFELGEMDSPPCFVCGYNGEGYYQPDKHPCAKRHHRLTRGEK